MVFYFTSNKVSPPAKIYMGKDKFENEELIKYGMEHDVWFHVDKLSSAHVYLRLGEDQTWDDIPQELLDDCAQLTKANSIEGNKKNNLTIIYTPWANLRKDAGMATGQVAFHKDKQVKRVHIAERINETVNRLNKTKKELYPDLEKEKIEYEKEKKRLQHKMESQRRQEQEQYLSEKRKEKELSSYDYIMNDESYQASPNSYKDIPDDVDPRDIEDDFM